MSNEEARMRRERAWVTPDLRCLADWVAGCETARRWLELETEAKLARKDQGR